MQGALLLALELLLGAGPAHYSECGTNGCWRQPPLPYHFDLDTAQQKAGVRLGDFEVVYRNYGFASVKGTFVPDVYYNPRTAQVAADMDPGQVATIKATQHQTGFTAAYAPRFEVTQWAIFQPSIGLAYVRQHETVTWYSSKWEPQWSLELYGKTRVTPMAALGAVFPVGRQVSLGIAHEIVYRPRYRDSVAGGGDEHRIGLKMWSFELRFAL